MTLTCLAGAVVHGRWRRHRGALLAGIKYSIFARPCNSPARCHCTTPTKCIPQIYHRTSANQETSATVICICNCDTYAPFTLLYWSLSQGRRVRRRRCSILATAVPSCTLRPSITVPDEKNHTHPNSRFTNSPRCVCVFNRRQTSKYGQRGFCLSTPGILLAPWTRTPGDRRRVATLKTLAYDSDTRYVPHLSGRHADACASCRRTTGSLHGSSSRSPTYKWRGWVVSVKR